MPCRREHSHAAQLQDDSADDIQLADPTQTDHIVIVLNSMATMPRTSPTAQRLTVEQPPRNKGTHPDIGPTKHTNDHQ
eukprot:12108610-Alexandrium_andersonii.AAC.1